MFAHQFLDLEQQKQAYFCLQRPSVEFKNRISPRLYLGSLNDHTPDCQTAKDNRPGSLCGDTNVFRTGPSLGSKRTKALVSISNLPNITVLNVSADLNILNC